MDSNAAIPRDRAFDSTLAFLREGYSFISNGCRRNGSDVFKTRLMLRPVICTLGGEAAAMFYHPGRFTRKGAMPAITLKLLQDKGSVHWLNGEAHRVRKAMFLTLMAPEALGQLAGFVGQEWRDAIRRWEAMDRVTLHPEVEEILCRAACRWAGVPLKESEARQRTREFAAMIEGAGSIGPRNWRGHLLRARAERWLRSLVARERAGELQVPQESAAHGIARHRDLNGELLEPAIVAVELANVLRPTVAVARYVTFAALALHEHPQWRRRLEADGGDEALEFFVQEVRRYYPLFPVIGGRVLEEFDWRERHFRRGEWVILDLYGTNHDPRIWKDPELFRPERFRDGNGSPFNFIPQGGGDHESGHRCAGEWLTIELLKTSVRLLTQEMRYEVPEQDLRIDLARMPALPASGFVLARVKAAVSKDREMR